MTGPAVPPSTPNFTFTDRRGRTASGLQASNINAAMAELRKSGYSLPRGDAHARAEVVNAQQSMKNRTLKASIDRNKLSNAKMAGNGMVRTASNIMQVQPKNRTPMGTLADKGIPYNFESAKELGEIRRWCNTPDAPVWMADYTFKAIGDIRPGEQVIGWETRSDVWGSGRRELVKTTVLAVNRRTAPKVIKVTFESGRSVECTPDHEWLRYYVPGPDGRILNGPEKSLRRRYTSEYAPLQLGSVARSVIRPTEPLQDIEKVKAASYLAGIIDGEGSWTKRTVRICQSPKHNPRIVERIDRSLGLLGLTYTRYVRSRDAMGHHYGGDMVVWDLCRPNGQGDRSGKNRQQLIDLYNWAHPAKMDIEHMDNSMLSRNFGEPEKVISIESLGPGEVVSMQTATGNYTAWGMASKNCRLFYACHDLVPLLVDIYSKFPLIGLEFESKDNEIRDFYTTMFLDGLDYTNWLPNAFAREYFISGEVTALAHFNEQLGTWASEEILNPDMLDVSRSMLVDRERVQLRVKEMVDNLRTGPGGVVDIQETESQRQERRYQYQMLERYYPEIMHAAAKDDGLDLSEALVSRIANRVSSWDLRGTPLLLRSFRTLMSEESLNAAQDAISDRLYSPFILAKLGVPNLGDGEPWIPDQTDLDNVRDDINNALMADLRVVVGNFSLDIESVFGREAMPRFDSDYDRIDRKIMQAWGIGEELISGGNASTYAGTAINREFVTQQMVGFQNLAKQHTIKRAEVIAEAQEHYDYEKKGAYRRPLYREIVETDPMTGEEHLVRVPKLLVPEVRFQTLNLRDEAQTRQFLEMFKSAGVPISDRSFVGGNIDIEFEPELERSSEETYQKLIAQAQTMAKVQAYCDRERKPYPPELVQHLSATLQLRQAMGQTEMLEAQAKQLEQQAAQASPAGQLGILPGTVAQPAAPAQGQTPGGPPMPRDPSQTPPPYESGQEAPPRPGPPPPSQQQLTASLHDSKLSPEEFARSQMTPSRFAVAKAVSDRLYAQAAALREAARVLKADGSVKTPGVPVAAPPTAAPPAAAPPTLPGVPVDKKVTEVPRNRARPAESDEMRAGMPTAKRRRQRKGQRAGEALTRKLTHGPSSYQHSHFDVTSSTEDERFEFEDKVSAAVRRRQRMAEHQSESSLERLLENPVFWEATEKRAFEAQIMADLPEILAVRGDYERMNKQVRTSARLLDEGLDQYEYIFGCVVERPDS